MVGRLLRRLGMLARRAEEHHALDDEIRLHLELLEARERAAGVPPAQARAAARQRFGNPLVHAEDARDALGLRLLAEVRHDVRYALRSLSRERRFAFTALATLALGTGATTAIFTILSALVLRPLPFPEADRLVALRSVPSAREAISNITAYREGSASFEALAGYEVGARYMRDARGAERVMAVRTEPAFFTVLGVPALQGRTYDPFDPTSVVVVSERFWRTRLGAAALGSPVPALAAARRDTRAALRDTIAQNWSQLSELGMTLVVRTVDRPEASIDAVRTIVREVNPGFAVFNVRTMEQVIADSLSDFTMYLWMIGGFAVLALLLAATGTYGVISYVAMARLREFAIRMALGADRGRVMRMVIVRGTVLALAGVAVGSRAR